MSNFIYNPDRKGKRQLIAEFVVRTEVLEDIMQDINTSAMITPEQHYLLIGQRGQGKTTLLYRIKYAIEDSLGVNSWLIPIVLTEEQYNINELVNLWESVADLLEDYHGFTGIVEEIRKYMTHPQFELKSYDIIEKYLDKHGKKLVLLIDNVGALLDKISDLEVRRLREVLQTKPHIRLIAASPFYFQDFADYKQPFFEFFKVKRLIGLSREETTLLLLELGNVHGQRKEIEAIISKWPGRIETLRMLTGGAPRTIALMFGILINHEYESTVQDLEHVLDAVTPFYKHRMDDLSPQNQKIVDAVAKNWDAISVKELREKTRIEGKVLSAQLSYLEKNQVIEKRPTETKNNLYLLRERFWNIWYLMRYGRRNDKQQVVWLIRFMEAWFSKKELEEKIGEFSKKIKEDKLSDKSIEYFSMVFTSISKISLELRVKLHDQLPESIANTIEIETADLLKGARQMIKKEKIDQGLDLLFRIGYPNEDTRIKIFEIICLIPERAVIDFAEKNSSDKKITCCSVLILFYSFFNSMMDIIDYFNDLSIEEMQKATKIIEESLLNIQKDIVNGRIYSEIEYLLMDIIFTKLISFHKVDIVQRFFISSQGEELKKRMEISYILANFFANNQDETLLLRLPDEKKQIILQKISEIRELIENTKKQ
ncbi:MAG: hypothetical protein P0Y53_09015 [Candidatus Pseudobacter hemicellulosilyticus]|uniref:Uncharacterized protein n=1 Tax=Candidatus Pseudobacter hemicellulosilyticus TaxID=3121375 RepID=A0AAJ6BIU0_9BACT|nr:MAG: hypothetical protein P0Y53_09015 [Pseudobacter sp.]